MKLKKDSSEQKLRGAYYTPVQLANKIIDYLKDFNFESVLEPSCGDGVFLESIVSSNAYKNNIKIDAVELVQSEAKKVADKFENQKNIEIFHDDFFNFYKEIKNKKKYDLVVGNPPYVRYQFLEDYQRKSMSQILTSEGMKANKLINVWVAFVVACVQLLNQGGKIAFIIPAEILQVAYAEDLRLYLSNNLSKITLITFKQLVFPDIEQEVVILIGEKTNSAKGIRIVELNNLNDFSNENIDKFNFQEISHVKEKWTKYFTTSEEINLIQSIKKDERFAKFSDYGVINVGITTGNNNYFSVTEDIVNKYKLDDYTLPLIGRSSHVHGIFFTDADFVKNKESGKSARLLNLPDIPYENYTEGCKSYIKLGEETGQNSGYKCSIRDRWYLIPSIWIPDAFFLRRNNLYPKFVLNKCNAVSTDTMHRIKFNDGVDAKNVLLAYYNSISFAFTEICGRSYGGGVLEILPSEMGNIMLPKIDNINITKRDEVLSKIDTIIRNNDNIEKALDIVDKEILENILGIDIDLCKKCRIIWKKMQQRRLNRKH